MQKIYQLLLPAFIVLTISFTASAMQQKNYKKTTAKSHFKGNQYTKNSIHNANITRTKKSFNLQDLKEKSIIIKELHDAIFSRPVESEIL